MSRIGRLPVVIPENVTVIINEVEKELTVKGPKGSLSLKIPKELDVEKKDNLIYVKRKDDLKETKAKHGLYRVLINNMIIGVTKGYEKRLEIVGTGYRANVQGKKLVLNLGYSIPCEYTIPDGISIKVDNNNTLIIIEGIKKDLVGETAAQIRKLRPPEPYKGKGIKYIDEVIKRKAGKTGK